MLNSTNINNDDEVVGELLELFHKDQTMFAIYKGPVTWESDADINDNVDVVMHLPFRGIVKSAIEQTTKWLKKRMKYGLFVKTTDGLLEVVQHLNLDWCRVLGFQRGKLGGWVLENYLGFARLQLWFFSMIDTVGIDKEYQEPLDNSRNWIKKENTSWLSARGLDKKGSAQELKERVQMYLQQTNIPLPRQSRGSVKGVVNVWKSLHSLLQIVMRTGEDAINTEEIDFWVRRFLSCYAKVDQGLQSSEDSHEKPSCVTSYNFMSLLNLPDAVRQFSPLCNIWEGGTQGEGFLWYVKREMSMGLQNNWQIQLLTRFYKCKSLAMLLSADIGMEEDTLAADDDEMKTRMIIKIILASTLYTMTLKNCSPTFQWGVQYPVSLQMEKFVQFVVWEVGKESLCLLNKQTLQIHFIDWLGMIITHGKSWQKNCNLYQGTMKRHVCFCHFSMKKERHKACLQ
ncbi:hypothetical protein ACA910_011550 [Epithemia clementina (nom. ined.)]